MNLVKNNKKKNYISGKKINYKKTYINNKNKVNLNKNYNISNNVVKTAIKNTLYDNKKDIYDEINKINKILDILSTIIEKNEKNYDINKKIENIINLNNLYPKIFNIDINTVIKINYSPKILNFIEKNNKKINFLLNKKKILIKKNIQLFNQYSFFSFKKLSNIYLLQILNLNTNINNLTINFNEICNIDLNKINITNHYTDNNEFLNENIEQDKYLDSFLRNKKIINHKNIYTAKSININQNYNKNLFKKIYKLKNLNILLLYSYFIKLPLYIENYFINYNSYFLLNYLEKKILQTNSIISSIKNIIILINSNINIIGYKIYFFGRLSKKNKRKKHIKFGILEKNSIQNFKNIIEFSEKDIILQNGSCNIKI